MKAPSVPLINLFSGTAKKALLKEHKTLILNIICLLLITMWVYAALSKLIDFEKSRAQMLNQVFPAGFAGILAWAVPIGELFIVALLAFEKSIRIGFAVSAVLLAIFSMYIAVVMTGIFGRIPCSCGGIIENMRWAEHLLFNLFFLGLSAAGFLLRKKTRKDTSIYKEQTN